MSRAVGIDLGTCNSVVAAMKDGAPVVLADAEGRRLQPSVVAFGYANTVVVGHRARRQLVHAPESTVLSAKRLLGRRYNSPEVQRMKGTTAFGITEGEDGSVKVRAQGRIFAPQEVSAHVLMHMRRVAENALGEPVTQAVITVPAYFNDAQRQATREAASLAGLECLRILNEPTAAALAYGFKQDRRQHIVVYDLGGGTFDVSILRIDGDFYEVLSTAGDTFLGGDDFDEVTADHFLTQFEQQLGVSLANQRALRIRLRDAAEQAKVALSQNESVDVHIPAAWKAPDGVEHDFKTRVDRYAYATWVMPLVQRTFGVCDEALRNARLHARQVDHVLLVGGMTRYPLVRDGVQQYFGKTPYAGVDPDEVVAIGAAIQAHTLTDVAEESPSVLLDVTPQSLSIRTIGGFCEVLLPRNTQVPADASKVFHTANDDQTEVRVAVFQGEARMAEQNTLLGEFVLADLPPLPRGQVRVKITFALDSDGILSVTAVDDKLGKVQTVKIEARAAGQATGEEIAKSKFDDEDTVIAPASVVTSTRKEAR
jgi:molecular chaperone DnaK